MNHALQVFRYELGRNLRRPAYLITTFFVPLIGFALFTLITSIGGNSTNTAESVGSAMSMIDTDGLQAVGVVNQSDFVVLPEGPDVGFIVYEDTDAGDAAVTAGDIDAYYIFPADYADTGQVIEVMGRLDLTRVTSAPPRQLILGSLENQVDPAIYARIVNPTNPQVVNLSEAATASSFDATAVLLVLFAVALLLSLLMTNGYLMQSVIEEKESRLIEILLSSMRPMQLLAGKIAAMGVLGLFQLVVWIGALYLITRITGSAQVDAISGTLNAIGGIRFPTEILPALLLYFLLAYLMFAAFYAAIGAISNNMREGPQYAVIFTLPMVVPMWFQSAIAVQPDGALAVILSIFPLTAPLAMLQRMLVTVVPTWQILLSIGILGLSALGAVWIAGRLFRVQSLLAGQVPKLRDFPALLRG